MDEIKQAILEGLWQQKLNIFIVFIVVEAVLFSADMISDVVWMVLSFM